jgi:hypothetical protein
MPALLLPRKGRYGLQDYEKIFCADIKSGQKNGQDIFDMRGIDRDARRAWHGLTDRCVSLFRPVPGIRCEF